MSTKLVVAEIDSLHIIQQEQRHRSKLSQKCLIQQKHIKKTTRYTTSIKRAWSQPGIQSS